MKQLKQWGYRLMVLSAISAGIAFFALIGIAAIEGSASSAPDGRGTTHHLYSWAVWCLWWLGGSAVTVIVGAVAYRIGDSACADRDS